ncbi:hypothetical protein A6U86_15560 [Rhizobium sp. AC27/96]|uniref:hypothetical protein n=1 Tax=Rhizobium sp. AC27/96 TaxID=1841653 RepID=UPI0008291923|nr:hypothetical protein [Rhizobium sp. AC27/96]OCI97028.1 hypothetical protein A6U86_15560 [Rhizobium sp. AC27/96]
MVRFLSNRSDVFDPIGLLAPRPWFGGESFHQNRWPIVWVNGKGSRLPDKPVEISFEEAITPWPNLTRLSDPGNEHDLLTSKLLIYLAMEPAPVGWLKAPSSVPGVHRRYLNLVRYRHVVNAPGNANLSTSHYRDFEARLLKGGVGALLDTQARARRLVEGYDGAEIEVEFGDRGYFFGRHIETLLGLSFNQLNPSAFAILKEFCDRRGFAFQRLERKLVKDSERINRKTTGDAYRKVWTALWDFREILSHDAIPFRAEPLGGGWAGEERRTPDSPPYQTSFLVNAALRLLLDDVALQILELAQLQGFASGKEQQHEQAFVHISRRLVQLGFDGIAVAYRHTRWTDGEGNSLRTTLFVIIVVACVIVLANFTARRDSELASLRPDCLSFDAFGAAWLECFITKNKNESVKLPATATIQKAVELLNKIGSAVGVDFR